MPISIDATDITGATIDGATVTEITIDGVVVFPDAPSSTLDVTSTLNSDSVILYAYEDTTGDGIANNTDSWTLSGGSESLDVSSFSLAAGNDFWWRVEAEDDTDITTAVEEIDVELNY